MLRLPSITTRVSDIAIKRRYKLTEITNNFTEKIKIASFASVKTYVTLYLSSNVFLFLYGYIVSVSVNDVPCTIQFCDTAGQVSNAANS